MDIYDLNLDIYPRTLERLKVYKALENYTNISYLKLNRELRTGYMYDRTYEQVRRIDRAINVYGYLLNKYHLDRPINLVRTVKLSPEHMMELEEMCKYGEYIDPGYMSTSKTGVLNYDYNVTFNIISNTMKIGADIQSLSTHPEEGEFLIMRETPFEVVSFNMCDKSDVKVKLRYRG